MKKRFVGSLEAGEKVDDIFVLSEKSLSQKKDGNIFLNAVLTDKSGSLKGVMWDGVADIAGNLSPGDFVHVQATVSEYRGSLQMVIKHLAPWPADGLTPEDFLPATGRDIENMFHRILLLTGTIENGFLKRLMEAFWHDEEIVRGFKSAPAAKKMHHAYIGGLLEHTLSMALLADRIVGHYKGIDRDLVLAGAMVHDIGKIKEFEYQTKIDYSDAGRLLSHISIGLQMVDEKINEISGFPEKLALLLKHMIVSHHGSREFGSPEPPKTLEAVLLNYIDEIDAKINAIRDFMASEDPNASWTSYHRVLERFFYKGKT
ncbi:MAG: HD domain-containing protein [Desulfobacterales bacterium]|nr:HD domain-containing protein [Desulfobacterales bacterium]